MPRHSPKKINVSQTPALPPSVRTAREVYEKTLREYRDLDMPVLTAEERKQMMTRMLPYAAHLIQMVLCGEIKDAKTSDRLFAADLVLKYTIPKPQNETEKEGAKTMGALKSFLLEQGHDGLKNGEVKDVAGVVTDVEPDDSDDDETKI